MTRLQLRAAEAALVAACVAPGCIGLALFRARGPQNDPSPGSVVTVVGGGADGHLADSLLRGVVELAPFRLVRQPATAAYQVGRPDAQVDAPSVQRPVLSLSGIISGRRPAALVDGVPGHEGSVLLQLGDTAAGLRLRQVGRDRVVVTGMDTTWTLTLRQAWTQ